jgi:hypothetical protein
VANELVPSVPPVISTVPSLSSAAVWNCRPTLIFAAGLNCAALTVIAPEVPVIDEDAVSVAETVCAAVLKSVTATLPVPLLNVASAGSTARLSLLLKCTVPL